MCVSRCRCGSGDCHPKVGAVRQKRNRRRGWTWFFKNIDFAAKSSVVWPFGLFSQPAFTRTIRGGGGGAEGRRATGLRTCQHRPRWLKKTNRAAGARQHRPVRSWGLCLVGMLPEHRGSGNSRFTSKTSTGLRRPLWLSNHQSTRRCGAKGGGSHQMG